MAKKRHIWLAGLLLAAIVGVIWLVTRAGDPVYEGRRLHVWLEQYGTNHWHPGGELEKQAQTALQHIGTNAIPIYLQFMTNRASRLKLKLLAAVPYDLRVRFKLTGPSGYEKQVNDHRLWGAYGIGALGPAAAPVVPALIGLLDYDDPEVRYAAVFALGSLGPVAREALPALIECLGDASERVRWNALASLGDIHEDPDRVVPILIRYLDSPDDAARLFALFSLGRYGAAAKPAVPRILSSMTNNANSGFRSLAARTLKEIDPEAADKAGVQ